jgi:hypothetical protein
MINDTSIINSSSQKWRRRRESNPRIKALPASAFPFGYAACKLVIRYFECVSEKTKPAVRLEADSGFRALRSKSMTFIASDQSPDGSCDSRPYTCAGDNNTNSKRAPDGVPLFGQSVRFEKFCRASFASSLSIRQTFETVPFALPAGDNSHLQASDRSLTMAQIRPPPMKP